MILYLYGAMSMAAFAITVFFFRFWQRTNERLFAFFSLAFFLLGIERVVLFLYYSEEFESATTYLIRLAAFIVIILGVIDKNRGKSRSSV